MVTEKIYINGMSIVAPGLTQPNKILAILRGEQQWIVEPLPNVTLDLLPANERRRTTNLIKIALQTLQPLLHNTDDLHSTATVFASSDGDLGIENKICQALAQDEIMISPTLFHNSVHNAPAGYWAIATSMHAASVSLSAGNSSFAAGLVDAITQVISEQQTVLFVAYDVVAPEPLDAVRHFDFPLAIALRLGLSRETVDSAAIRISIGATENTLTVCQNRTLEPLRTGNPIGAGLPLLELLARKSTSSIVIPYVMNKYILCELFQ